jgi:ferredoxin
MSGTDLNYGDCIGCGLCILGCPAYEETGFDLLTARGRNKALQAGLGASEMAEPIWACTLCGYCDAICPNGVNNVKIVLDLRRQLSAKTDVVQGFSPSAVVVQGFSPAVSGGPKGLRYDSQEVPATRALVLGCTIRERAPHLIPSIEDFLRRIGRPIGSADETCCGALDVEAGRVMPSRVKAGVVADPVCLEQYDAEFLGLLAMQHLDMFQFKAPFYYYAPHRIINRDHAIAYPLYDALRRRFDCGINLDLNRLARSTSASSIQGLSGRDARDIPAAVGRLLASSPAERIITCSPADYLAFKAYSGRETLFITECLR